VQKPKPPGSLQANTQSWSFCVNLELEVTPPPEALPAFLYLCGFLLFFFSTWALLRQLEAAERRSFVGTICKLVRPFLLFHHAFVSRVLELTLLALFGTAVQHLGHCSQGGCRPLSIDGLAALAGVAAVLALLQLRGGDWVIRAIGLQEPIQEGAAKGQLAAMNEDDRSTYAVLSEIFAADRDDDEDLDSDSSGSCPGSPCLGAVAAAGSSLSGACNPAAAFNEVHIRVPSKVILFGEHSVCHGKPALVGTVPIFLELRAVAEDGLHHSLLCVQGREEVLTSLSPHCESFNHPEHGYPAETALIHRAWAALPAPPAPLRVTILSEVPIGMGLGSSSSLLAALTALSLAWEGREEDTDALFQRAWRLEKALCYSACSGVDLAAVIYGGLFMYHNGVVVKRFDPEEATITLIPTSECHSTGALVEGQSALQLHNRYVYDDMGALVEEAARHVQEWDLDALAILAEQNQVLLMQAGVPWNPGFEMPYGSKLTGSGGGGYCIQFPTQREGRKLEGSLSVPVGREQGVRVRRLSVVSDVSQ